MVNYLAFLVLELYRSYDGPVVKFDRSSPSGGRTVTHLGDKLLGYWIASDVLEIAALSNPENGQWGWEIVVGPKGFRNSTELLSQSVSIPMQILHERMQRKVENRLYSTRPEVLVSEFREAREDYPVNRSEDSKGEFDRLYSRVDYLEANIGPNSR